MRLPRRFVLAALPAGIGGWVVARLWLGGGSDVQRLMRLLGDPEKARAIGEACLRAIDQAPAEEIARSLPAESDFRASVRADFAAGRIVLADSWVLSATEARLYALVAMTS